MTIAGVGNGSMPWYNGNTKSSWAASASTFTMENTRSSNITLNMSGGAIFSEGKPNGESFSIYKGEDYSIENPVMLIKGKKANGETYEQEFNVHNINTTNATYQEMMAFTSYLVDAGEIKADDLGTFVRPTDDDFEKANYLQALRDWRDDQYDMGNFATYKKASSICTTIAKMNYKFYQNPEEITKGSSLTESMSETSKAPYSHLAVDGIIDYNGVIFVCDNEKQTISLGDTSDKNNCLNIPLENGGNLIVNKDNLGDLSQVIDMFSPEDVNRILRAIAQNTKVEQMQQEIDDDTNSIGDAAEEQEE